LRWDADGVRRTGDDGPAPWRSSDDLHTLARYDARVVIDVEHDLAGRERDDAVPGTATQTTIHIGARPSPL